MVKMKIGDLVTPTGRLVLASADLGGELWLQARRWRNPADVLGRPTPLFITPEDPDYAQGYRIGSSDVASILDLDGVDTPAHVYREKVYNIQTPPNERMLWGKLFEQPIALEWCRRNRAVIDEIGLVAKDGAAWHQSTIDRRVRECPVDPGADCGLEVKHVDFVYPPRWRTANGLPDRITAQLIHQNYVTGYDHMHYAIKTPDGMLQGVHRNTDEPGLTELVIGEVEKFREKYLLTGTEPPWNLDKPDKMIALDNASHPERSGVAEIDVEGIGDVIAYAEAAAAESAAKKRKEQFAARLRQLAAGAEIATFSGERAYWYGESGRTDCDLEMLRERWPDAYAACVAEKRWPVLHIDKAHKPRGAQS